MSQQQNQEFHQSNMQMGSGLTRYRSAPSSYFATLLDSSSNSSPGFGTDDFAQLFNPRASSPETQRIFSRFMNSTTSDTTLQANCSSNITVQPQTQWQQQQQQQLNAQFLQPAKNESEVVLQTHQRPPLHRQQSNDYSSVYQGHNNPESSNSVVENSYNRVLGSMNSNSMGQMKIGGGGGRSGLIRHSSSPAGLFANINIEELVTMRGMGSYGGGNSANAEASSRFKHPSSSGMMAPISEIETKNSQGDGQFDEDHGNEKDYIPGFPMNSWEDSTMLSDNFLNELADDDTKPFSNANALDDQNIEGGNRPTNPLSHQLSLPTSSAELSAMEKFLQDSVPCKIRAKRGCATHPRSIAERVRRTKISQRMRKLQELVPNMEKQTNTADMLDLAVDYIKELQKQVKKLSDNRARCSCSAKEQ